jgi:hypothetical protein
MSLIGKYDEDETDHRGCLPRNGGPGHGTVPLAPAQITGFRAEQQPRVNPAIAHACQPPARMRFLATIPSLGESLIYLVTGEQP